MNINIKQLVHIGTAVLALELGGNFLQAAPPVVSNIRAAQRAGTHLVDIY